ncbi:MAG: nickel transporter, partial [Verrucomicrobiales bacterium]|nr:nickel transporter [Verrucomicrobiales bacterium]
MELLLIGFVAGFAHVVTGPDHLAALTPFASRDGHAATWRLGLRWGLGHAAGVAVVGMLLWLLKDTAMVEGFSAWAERLVGVLLIAVGALGLQARLSGKIHTHEHAHSGVSHSHIHSHFGRTEHRHSHAALGIGLLHGTAGGTHLWVLLPTLAIGHLGGVILY